MIAIDGNQKSGSGTIVRDAAGLAALSGKAIIKKGDSSPIYPISRKS
jgi:RNA 3'-terminal phosphate cyclase